MTPVRHDPFAAGGAKASKYLVLALMLFLAACHNLSSAKPAASPMVTEGKTFAETSCRGCHAVGRDGASSLSTAPPFREIVNREGLTSATLSSWLRGAHNYPNEMDFVLRERDVDALVVYMLTLNERNYRPPAASASTGR